MIPRIIHRFWTGSRVPEEFRRYGVAWRRLNPEWMLRDWGSDEGLRPLANQRYYDDAGRYTPPPVKNLHRFRSDLIRLELLARIGGVYVDMDTEPLKPLDALFEPGDQCLIARSANATRSGERIVCGGFLASVPGHPFLLDAIRRIPESAESYRGKHTAVSVGPYHLQRVYASRPWPTVRIIPTECFYPQSIAERRAGLPVDLSRSYGWHRWANSRSGDPVRHA